MILVKQPGLFTTVQDLGRQGFGPQGVSASGAADPIALRMGNLLVGNPEAAAGLEMTLLGGTFEFQRNAVVALTGSEFEGSLPWGMAHLVRAGETVRIGPTQTGARGYLCVQGGFHVPLFYGSASTHILSGLGGFEGRAIRKGDVLKIGPSLGISGRALNMKTMRKLSARKDLRVTPGTQWSWFADQARRAFLAGFYLVTEESNRMGLRLSGPALPAMGGGGMITEGVPLGAVQVAAGGQPIILFVEQQTTGGYPKIANVIAADLPSVGQLRPRDSVRFELVSFEDARRLIREQEALFQTL